MIKLYSTGAEFLRDNLHIIRANPLETTFFEGNAMSLDRCDDKNFALKIELGNEILLCVHVGNYPAVLFGSAACAEELAKAKVENGLQFNRTLGAEDVSCAFWKQYERHVGGSHKVNLTMDVMICNSVVPCDVSDVSIADVGDAEQIARLVIRFTSETTHENATWGEIFHQVCANISNYMCIKREGKVVSVATYVEESNGLCRIHGVYTLPEYRNCGYSRKVVTKLTEDILRQGHIAYLHVDKKNPISNRLYLSIGYNYGKTKLETVYCK